MLLSSAFSQPVLSTLQRCCFSLSLWHFFRALFLSVTSLWIWSPAIQLSPNSEAGADTGDTAVVKAYSQIYGFLWSVLCSCKRNVMHAQTPTSLPWFKYNFIPLLKLVNYNEDTTLTNGSAPHCSSLHLWESSGNYVHKTFSFLPVLVPLSC